MWRPSKVGTPCSLRPTHTEKTPLRNASKPAQNEATRISGLVREARATVPGIWRTPLTIKEIPQLARGTEKGAWTPIMSSASPSQGLGYGESIHYFHFCHSGLSLS